MSHHPDLLALQIDLTRQLLASAVAERDRYTHRAAWKPRTHRRRAAADRAVDELHTMLAELEARRRPVHAIILRANGRHHLLCVNRSPAAHCTSSSATPSTPPPAATPPTPTPGS